MNLFSGDERDRLLAAAWDEATAPYQVPGTTLLIRPFSANVLRRAGTMGLRCLYGPFAEVLAALQPSEALADLEALAWLLTADLDGVRATMRSRTWATTLEAFELPRGAIGPFRDEMVRVLALIDAAKFEIEDKPKPPTPPGRAPVEEPDPPAHQIRPGILAALAFALAEKVGRPADEVLEWIPACQIFQLAHCQQWGNPSIWTVDPSRVATVDPWEGAAPEADPGVGEAIEF
jgi:hypothetical protein